MVYQAEICDSLTKNLITEDGPLPFVASVAFINLVLSLTAFAGNFIIVLVLKKCRTIHPPSRALLFSLALTDLGVGLFSQPLFAASKIIGYRQDFNKIVCIIAVFDSLFGDALAAVSLLTVTVISVDRYLAYRLRGRYRAIVTLKKTLVAIAFCWMIACLWIGLRLGSKSAAQQLQTVVASFCFLLTFACYTRVCLGLRFSKTHIQARNIPNVITMACYKKSAMTMAYVCGFLLLCYSPHFILEAISSLFVDEQTYLRIKTCTKTAAYFSSSINPLIYFWRIQEIFELVSSIISRLCFLICRLQRTTR